MRIGSYRFALRFKRFLIKANTSTLATLYFYHIKIIFINDLFIASEKPPDISSLIREGSVEI